MSLLPLAGYRRADDAVLLGPAGGVGAAIFFAQAARLARALPGGGLVINVCETRHGFMLGFAAALMRGQVSLLPPARGREAREALQRRYAGAYVISETAAGEAGAFALGAFLEDRTAGALEIPGIDSNAAVSLIT